jgi:colanic acid/amylovoran biosynthesis glycosyltransferase
MGSISSPFWREDMPCGWLAPGTQVGMTRIAVVLRKERHNLGYSETFVRTHVERLPGDPLLVIGIPGRWKVGTDFIPSRALVPLAGRWMARRSGASDVSAQDQRAMASFLRRAGIGAVLAEYGPSAVSIMDACRDADVPLVAHFHGYDVYTKYVLDTFGRRYGELFSAAAAVVGVSRHMCERLIALGADPARVHYNSCGADLPPGAEARPHEQPPRFAMIGRLTEKKAPLVTLLAFARMDIPEATLDVIGSGPLLDACKHLVWSLRLQDRVQFHGARPHSQVIDLLRRARCFVQHSVTGSDGDREGTPVALLEAMGLGLPVVATWHGGIPDVVGPRLGSLVPEFDVDAMADAMRKFALDPELARRTGQCARNEIRARWTADHRTRRLAEIIEAAVHGRQLAAENRAIASTAQ